MIPTGIFPLADARIRDPFLLPVARERAYYLFGSAHAEFTDEPAGGFDCYRSTDLVSWRGPYPAFRPPPGFWADRNFWAPEVHPHAGRYFMLATFDAWGVARGTQVLVADRPAGPYVPWSDGPVTPPDWDCSGGTLHIDAVGEPWIVYCRDGVPPEDSRFVAQRLSQDLTRPARPPFVLFEASDASWATRRGAGPFLHRLRSGELLMLWSSPTINGSLMGVSRSENGRVTGRWIHSWQTLIKRGGGHGMIAATLDGELLLTWHHPNTPPFERAVAVALIETRKTLRLPAGTPNPIPPRDDDPDRLRRRLDEIQVERFHVLSGSYVNDKHEYGSENRSDALHDLAKEEQRIRDSLGLGPGPWDPGRWPDWGGWLLLTALVTGILLLAWATG